MSAREVSAVCCLFFFFNDTATTEIYTLSLHDALPILGGCRTWQQSAEPGHDSGGKRSEEHTSELQSLRHLVCRLLLEKKQIMQQTVNCRYVCSQRAPQELPQHYP